MPRLYLIRHARPTSNWGQGDDDAGLDAVGHEQAAAACAALMAAPADQRPSRVVSSPLRRCRETAAPLARALGVEIEIDPAVGEIPTPISLPADERPAWLQRAFGGVWSEIEGDLDYLDWRRAAADALKDRGGAAVFSHFVAINAVVSLLSGDERVVCFRPDHASVSVLETDGGDLRLITRGREAETGVL